MVILFCLSYFKLFELYYIKKSPIYETHFSMFLRINGNKRCIMKRFLRFLATNVSSSIYKSYTTSVWNRRTNLKIINHRIKYINNALELLSPYVTVPHMPHRVESRDTDFDSRLSRWDDSVLFMFIVSRAIDVMS